MLLHILHGAGSFLQSLGATNENTFCAITTSGKVAAFVIGLVLGGAGLLLRRRAQT